MPGLHQLVAAASPGDAITNNAFELRDILRRVGPSEIYAQHVAPELSEEVRQLRQFPPRQTHDILIHHASIGEPSIHGFLMSRREPLVLIYHNVTPAQYFERWSPALADLLDLGRRELNALRSRVSLAIADSRYNARELEMMGYTDVRILPPLVDPWALHGLGQREGTTAGDDQALPIPFVLSVGQILPHKRPELLVDAMHIATTYLDTDISMMLVGHVRIAAYADAVRAKIAELNLPRVNLIGPVSRETLATMFRRATALVIASEHEGFCVPAVEAMTFDLPVIARTCTAIPETVDDAALLLPRDAGPALFAEAIAEIVSRPRLREELIERGRRRRQAFSRDRTEARFLRLLADVA